MYGVDSVIPRNPFDQFPKNRHVRICRGTLRSNWYCLQESGHCNYNVNRVRVYDIIEVDALKNTEGAIDVLQQVLGIDEPTRMR